MSFRPDYPDKDEVDALLATKILAVGASDIEITDSSYGLVLAAIDGSTNRLRIVTDGGATAYRIVQVTAPSA